MRLRTGPASARSSRPTTSTSASTACSAASSRSAPVSDLNLSWGWQPGESALKSRDSRQSQESQPMAKDVKARKTANLATPTDLGANATKELTGGLNILLADVYALYLKTKNFHWHMSGPHFRDYHLLLDDQSDQIYAMADPIAERVRKVGGSTIRSIGDIARHQRLRDNDEES